jgi:hypothetical protein
LGAKVDDNSIIKPSNVDATIEEIKQMDVDETAII